VGVFVGRSGSLQTAWFAFIERKSISLLVSKIYKILTLTRSFRLRWAGHVARIGEERNVYKVLMGKPEGKRPLRRPRRRWEDGIRMDLREIGWGV
jgi:hypothetical protein